jgi:hypothetical protein
MRSAATFLLALVASAFMVMAPAYAQEEASGASFITPFPSGDVYNLIVIGDDLAVGLHDGLSEAFTGDARLLIRPKSYSINGLLRPEYAEKLVALEEDLKREPTNIAVVMLGAWDRVTARDATGKRLNVGSAAWKSEYAARADRLIKTLKRQNVAVYWVGLPNVRRSDYNEDAQMMNDTLRERVYLNGIKYIDAYAGFTDETGGYSPFGPDIAGKIVRLREGDGVYFTSAGNRKLAHFVERELKRDLVQAKADRAIPLAGTEEEQARINPGKAPLAAEPPANQKAGNGTAPSAQSPADPGSQQTASSAPQPAESVGVGEQKADNGKINLRMIGASGRDEVVAVDIVRPAISASVVQLVTRRESPDRPSQMGESLVDQIAGGLTVISSVTPSSAGGGSSAQRKMSAAQTPYFRVLFKGERLPAKPGRADDVSWPRPEARAPEPAAVMEEPPARPAGASSGAIPQPKPAKVPAPVTRQEP